MDPEEEALHLFVLLLCLALNHGRADIRRWFWRDEAWIYLVYR
jgi:hypothetical protein